MIFIHFVVTVIKTSYITHITYTNKISYDTTELCPQYKLEPRDNNF